MTEAEEMKDLNDLREQTKRNKSRALRDQFAMAALTGLIAQLDGRSFLTHSIAKDAFSMADAMMEMRGEDS